ncbi:MAG: hypothetical protein A2621_04195 [Alphaproteobacteria bacterium RIFCSPHIGHO2_01_FULL_41_14]|nr:MAG: hypothetical protein A2065_03940 [Alphaproteobacteria bacterium GWB1_45_5]OFW76009.1 MAG: hypothetical protein A3K20_04125 [Alphaproteobacteria bacterium GWA1_45_9]OFW90048.1 MAG: hypothetical protein A2621_04195 [Alphaproteobacteria bacterium RIFCSPHIGHO2_01_FULL_41_14]HCI48579.1 hypothetical protein [Holosporales bacterium]
MTLFKMMLPVWAGLMSITVFGASKEHPAREDLQEGAMSVIGMPAMIHCRQPISPRVFEEGRHPEDNGLMGSPPVLQKKQKRMCGSPSRETAQLLQAVRLDAHVEALRYSLGKKKKAESASAEDLEKTKCLAPAKISPSREPEQEQNGIRVGMTTQEECMCVNDKKRKRRVSFSVTEAEPLSETDEELEGKKQISPESGGERTFQEEANFPSLGAFSKLPQAERGKVIDRVTNALFQARRAYNDVFAERLKGLLIKYRKTHLVV